MSAMSAVEKVPAGTWSNEIGQNYVLTGDPVADGLRLVGTGQERSGQREVVKQSARRGLTDCNGPTGAQRGRSERANWSNEVAEAID